jgi:16S rRNA processing protein RimM
MAAPDDMVLIGVITAAHGIRGEVKLTSFAADPAAIGSYGALVTSAGQAVEIDRLRPQKGGFIASLKGVGDRNRAEALKGTQLFVPRSRLPETGAGEVYVHDLIGLAARRMDGSHIGKVVGIVNYGAGDLLEVNDPERKDTVLIPFADPFVPTIDIARGFITVDLPAGYFDETA